MPKRIPFKLKDSIELIDWTGRSIREDKRGSNSENYPPILTKLNINPDQRQKLSQQFEVHFKGFVGEALSLTENCVRQGYKRSPGIGNCPAILN